MKLRTQCISDCEDLDGFSAITADMLVEVDTGTESDGSLMSRRGEQEEKPDAARILLLLAGLITKTTGSPVTTFTQVVRHAADAVSIALTPRMVDETIVANVHCSLSVDDPARFNGFLFKVNGKLMLFAGVQGDGAGHGIGPN